MQVFKEYQSIPKIFIVITLVILIGSLVMIFSKSSELIGDLWIVAGIDAFILFVFLNFSVLKIEIVNYTLEVSFGLFKKKFVIKDIFNLELKDYHFMDFGGYGLRMGRNKTMGFIAGARRGLSFEILNQKRKYFVTVNEAEKLYTYLIQYGAKK